jgi:hypothetical protein
MDKVEINRIRRKAQRLGMRLEKSPRRDRMATDFDTFALYSASDDLILGDPQKFGFGISLGRVERYLDQDVLVVEPAVDDLVPENAAILRYSHDETRGRLTAAVWQLTTTAGDVFELPQWSDRKAVELDARAILHRLRSSVADGESTE